MSSRWSAGTWRSFATPDRRLLLLSVFLQLALGLLFGHSYDTRVFMGTGYLVGTGQSPYVPQDLSAVFHHVGFNVMATVGYPPPWPLVLGLLYRGVYAVVPNLLAYNLAIKIPVIAANIGLAYLVAAILQNLGASPAVSRRAWLFLLLNPFLLYFAAAWGQIDAIVALLSLASLALLYAGKRGTSAVMLALAVCVKPTALPILLVAGAYLLGRSRRWAALYTALFAVGVFLFYVAPFYVFGWSSALVLQRPNAQFIANGGMSYMTTVRLFTGPLLLSGHRWFLGLAWIPALAVGVLALRRGIGGLDDLVKKSAALILIFFLTRTWLSETNVVLLLPLVLILTSLGRLDRRALTAVWVIPLVFTLFNCSPLQLLFVSFPGAMQRSLAFAAHYHVVTLTARAAAVVAWQVTGWSIVVTCLRRGPAHQGEKASEGLVPWR